ncbi:MAG: glycosyltransferase family 2 protein, partial [Streptococcus salivarius]|nr:glycosyltransferase family 2 protein [Streptococcus salivarius]
MYIIIPAYEPDKRLIQVVQDITIKLPKARIIVVNDGSGPGYNDYYDETAFIGATVLTHPINKGKGAALKTAFAHIQEEVVSQHLSVQPIVTVDSDGQHLIKDIVRVAKATEENPSHLVLGARAFVGKVPTRSRFGNKVTAGLFRLVTGQKVTDTQTGLRGMSTDLIPWLLNLDGNRFEYEFNMLLEAKKSGHQISEVPIETVYLEENKSSHFRPIRDSIRIYSPFLKFSGTAVLASVIDATALFVLFALTKNLLLSVVLARVISASSQCFLNANVVFNPTSSLFRSSVRYFMLVLVLLACNYFLLSSLVAIGLGLVVAKLVTETLLFLVSYRVQHNVVFA